MTRSVKYLRSFGIKPVDYGVDLVRVHTCWLDVTVCAVCISVSLLAERVVCSPDGKLVEWVVFAAEDISSCVEWLTEDVHAGRPASSTSPGSRPDTGGEKRSEWLNPQTLGLTERGRKHHHSITKTIFQCLNLLNLNVLNLHVHLFTQKMLLSKATLGIDIHFHDIAYERFLGLKAMILVWSAPSSSSWAIIIFHVSLKICFRHM